MAVEGKLKEKPKMCVKTLLDKNITSFIGREVGTTHPGALYIVTKAGVFSVGALALCDPVRMGDLLHC